MPRLASRVTMAMMEIGIVRMLVAHGRVPVQMAMRLAHIALMGMGVMVIMRMPVFVDNFLMRVIVVVPLGEV